MTSFQNGSPTRKHTNLQDQKLNSCFQNVMFQKFEIMETFAVCNNTLSTRHFLILKSENFDNTIFSEIIRKILLLYIPDQRTMNFRDPPYHL